MVSLKFTGSRKRRRKIENSEFDFETTHVHSQAKPSRWVSYRVNLGLVSSDDCNTRVDSDGENEYDEFELVTNSKFESEFSRICINDVIKMLFE